jgi:hypothetical protein
LLEVTNPDGQEAFATEQLRARLAERAQPAKPAAQGAHKPLLVSYAEMQEHFWTNDPAGLETRKWVWPHRHTPPSRWPTLQQQSNGGSALL